MTVYVLRDGKLVEKQWAPPSENRSVLPMPQIMPDIPEYMSPAGTGLITSRSQRKEDLKKSGCREVDPSEYQPKYVNPKFAKKRGLRLAEPGESSERPPGNATRYNPDGSVGHQYSSGD